MKKLLLVFVLIISVIYVSAQGVLSWQKTYGGTGHEYIQQTIPTADGGFAFTGYTESINGDLTSNQGGEDLWVAKANAAGTLEWSFAYGGTEDEEGMDIIQLADGSYFVVGYTGSGNGNVIGHHGTYNTDVWVLHIRANGSLMNNKCYGGTNDDDGVAIELSQDGKLYVAGSAYSDDGDVVGIHGSSQSDVWLLKLDTALTLLGQKCVGGTEYEEAMELVCTADNGMAVTGRTYSTDGDITGYHAGSDLLVTKLSSALVVEWAKCYGGSETEEGNSIVQNADQSYTVLGYTSTHNNGDVTGHHGSQGMDDYWLINLSTSGVLNWAKCYGGSGDDQANGLTKSVAGGYAMSGLTNSTDGDVTGFHTGFFTPDYWVARVDATGTLLWQRCCGGADQDESFRIYEESSNLFVVTGFTYSPDGDVTNWKGDADGWIIKVTGSAGVQDLSLNDAILCYPNPATDLIYIDGLNQDASATVYDLTGKVLIFEDHVANQLDISGLVQGVYFIELTSESRSVVRRIIKN